MWAQRTIGLALALAGVAVFGALLYPYFTHSLKTGSIFQSSIPVSVLTGMVAMIAFVFGAHLALPDGIPGTLRRRKSRQREAKDRPGA